MIIDTLDNAGKYIHLHPRFAKAFDFIKSQNLETIEPGKFEIDVPINYADYYYLEALLRSKKLKENKALF